MPGFQNAKYQIVKMFIIVAVFVRIKTNMTTKVRAIREFKTFIRYHNGRPIGLIYISATV